MFLHGFYKESDCKCQSVLIKFSIFVEGFFGKFHAEHIALQETYTETTKFLYVLLPDEYILNKVFCTILKPTWHQSLVIQSM